MDEARRFLRYIMPGFIYGVETTCFLFIIFPSWMSSHFITFTAKDSLGIVLSSIFASGALGYIFATIHHWCHWHLCFDKDILDHSKMINHLIMDGYIPKQDKREVDRMLAFKISQVLWYQQMKLDDHIGKESDKKVTSLGDQTHGLGTVRIASFFALITSLVFCYMIGKCSCQPESIIRFMIMVALGISVICLFHEAYRRVGKIAQALYEGILQEALTKDRTWINFM
jgi:hypothetical protein